MTASLAESQIAEHSSITWLLERWNAGDRAAAEQALPRLYDQLRSIARREFRGERREHTLQPTALVHEAYVELVEDGSLEWRSKAQFLGAAACVMRRVLVNHARHRNRLKRGGGFSAVTLEEALHLDVAQPPDIEALHEALVDLERVDPLKAAIVEMRMFGGLSIAETASCLDVAPITVSRHWRRAKAWLYKSLSAG